MFGFSLWVSFGLECLVRVSVRLSVCVPSKWRRLSKIHSHPVGRAPLSTRDRLHRRPLPNGPHTTRHRCRHHPTGTQHELPARVTTIPLLAKCAAQTTSGPDATQEHILHTPARLRTEHLPRPRPTFTYITRVRPTSAPRTRQANPAHTETQDNPKNMCLSPLMKREKRKPMAAAKWSCLPATSEDTTGFLITYKLPLGPPELFGALGEWANLEFCAWSRPNWLGALAFVLVCFGEA